MKTLIIPMKETLTAQLNAIKETGDGFEAWTSSFENVSTLSKDITQIVTKDFPSIRKEELGKAFLSVPSIPDADPDLDVKIVNLYSALSSLLSMDSTISKLHEAIDGYDVKAVDTLPQEERTQARREYTAACMFIDEAKKQKSAYDNFDAIAALSQLVTAHAAINKGRKAFRVVGSYQRWHKNIFG